MATFNVSFADESMKAEVQTASNTKVKIDSKPIMAKMEVINSSEFNANFSQDDPMNIDIGEIFEIQALEGDYNSLENKPKINGVTLIGDKSSEDLNITGVTDHRELTHRDSENQHPIDAITYLEPELAIRPSEALTNQDIQRILNM